MNHPLRAAWAVIIAPAFGVALVAHADGVLDPTFGTGGVVTTNFAVQDEAAAIAVQADFKLVVAGASGGNVAVARYNPNGSLDPTFGALGLAGGPAGAARGVAVLPGGKILVAAADGTKFMAIRCRFAEAWDPRLAESCPPWVPSLG